MPRFIPRVRKQKPRARLQQQQQQQSQSNNENVAELLPKPKQAREAGREQMRAELRAQPLGHTMSSKKKKRLDKYIDTKLKKQENIELIKKLGEQTFDTTLLKSSSRLGRSRDTKREALTQALEERRYGLSTPTGENFLLKQQQVCASSSSEDDGMEQVEHNGAGTGIVTMDLVPSKPSPRNSHSGPASLGLGLKRALKLDEDGNPVIQPRKRHRRANEKTFQAQLRRASFDSETSLGSERSSWEGFGTESEEVGLSNNVEHTTFAETSADDSAGETVEEDEADDGGDMLERTSAFKAWAQSQRNISVGFTPSRDPVGVLPSMVQTQSHAQAHSSADIPQASNVSFQTSSIVPRSDRKVFHVPINRPPDVNHSRQDLPVVSKEQEIMEAVFHNDVIILSGATGSGKTTQIPQFLFEAGYGDPQSPTPGMIGITQPRRVAAVSMAKRVAYEMGQLKDRVAHQIRFDSSVSSKTAMKFMTDGVLVREIAQDFTLSKYSALVLDEAHERSVNTDILIGMLSRIVETRRKLSAQSKSTFKPLKVLIMSATLRAAEFRDNRHLFRTQPPLVDVEGKQYNVSTHFARKTKRDYVEDMFQKLSRGHKKLPAGSMLVFMTGQNEIEYLEKRLKSSLPCTERSEANRPTMHISAKQVTIEDDDLKIDYDRGKDATLEEDEYVRDLSDDGLADANDEFDLSDEGASGIKRIHVLPLYSQLPADQQARVFEQPPKDSRLIILATNIAETSITIPNIRYVFDSGRAKVKQYNSATGVQTFVVDWISKASAQQRAGRAGRVGPGGHCYRLYSSAIFEDAFPQFTKPEITETPVEGVILQLKSLGIPDVGNFPFPTPLEPTQLQRGERLLQFLNCVEAGKGRVTEIGKQLSTYPLTPRLARILALAQNQTKMIDHALSLVATLGVPEIFVSEAQLGLHQEVEPSLATGEGETVWSQTDAASAIQRERLRQEYQTFHTQLSQSDKYSDGVKRLTVFHQYCAATTKRDDKTSSALERFTRPKILREAVQLRSQLTAIVAFHSSTSPSTAAPLSAPTSAQALLIRSLLAAGYIDNLAQRADLSPTPPETKRSPNSATQVPYITLFPSKQGSLSKAAIEELDKKNKEKLEYVYVHSSSVLAHVSPQKLPRFVVYSHLSTSSPPTITTANPSANILRTRMHPLSPVAAETVVELIRGTPLEDQGKPIGKIEQLSRNAQGEERRAIWSVPCVKSGSGLEGGREWPLPPARRIVQARKGRRGWVEEH